MMGLILLGARAPAQAPCLNRRPVMDLGIGLKTAVWTLVAIVFVGSFIYALRLNRKDTKDYDTESQSYNPPL